MSMVNTMRTEACVSDACLWLPEAVNDRHPGIASAAHAYGPHGHSAKL